MSIFIQIRSQLLNICRKNRQYLTLFRFATSLVTEKFQKSWKMRPSSGLKSRSRSIAQMVLMPGRPAQLITTLPTSDYRNLHLLVLRPRVLNTSVGYMKIYGHGERPELPKKWWRWVVGQPISGW